MSLKHWLSNAALFSFFRVMICSSLLAAASFATASPIETTSPSSPSLEQQIWLLDFDILLLKAELARKNADAKQLKQHLVALYQMRQSSLAQVLSEEVQMRLKALEDYAEDLSQQDTFSAISESFKFDDRNIVVLLPMTGPYADAGEAILSGIRSTLESETKLHVFDTNLYASMVELWELVKLYEPSFVFGPLEKEKVAALLQLETGVPTLAMNLPQFSQIDKSKEVGYFKMLAPNLRDQVRYLMELIVQNGYQKIGVLYDESIQSQQLKFYFDQAWSIYKQQTAEETLLVSSDRGESSEASGVDLVQIESALVKTNLDKALSSLLGVTRSQGREGWLARTLESRIVAEPRARKDLEVVVSLLPSREAMQVTPLLNFYHLNSVLHVWLPSELPKMEKFAQSLNFWQPTLVVLPDYFAQKVVPDHPSYQGTLNTSPVESDLDNKTGTFYALGRLAVESVKKITTTDRSNMKTVLGTISFQQGNFHIFPSAYWLDEGALEKVK